MLILPYVSHQNVKVAIQVSIQVCSRLRLRLTILMFFLRNHLKSPAGRPKKSAYKTRLKMTGPEMRRWVWFFALFEL